MKTVSVDISQCNAGAGGTTSSIQPTIMVKDSNYGAASVNAGDTFTLNLTSYNTSSTLGVSNVVTQERAQVRVREGDLILFHYRPQA